MQNFESPSHQTPDTNSWDMSNVPFAGAESSVSEPSSETNQSSPSSNMFNQGNAASSDVFTQGNAATAENVESPADPAETAIANVSYWGEAYNSLEAQFMKYRETVDFNDPDSRVQYKTMLRRYEEEVRNVWGYMEDATKTANSYNKLGDPYSRSAAQGINIPGGEEGDTIEASSSIFYASRTYDLENAILQDDSLTSEEKKTRGDLIASTWDKVLARIEANQNIAERRKDPEEHFYRCNELHDDLIRHLNQLNDLADHYGTERLTPRNFITNDRNYSKSRDRNGDYHARVETDRSIVDYYFRQVFSREYYKAERQIKRELGIAA